MYYAAPDLHDSAGQSLLEFLLSLSSVVLTLSTAGWLMKAEWDRGKCAYIVFERTHAQVTGTADPSENFGTSVDVQTLPDSVQGSALCGQSSESVSLPQLDPESL